MNRRVSMIQPASPICITHAAILIIALATAGWSSTAFCGEIHDATRVGDLEKVKALLKNNPELVFGKDYSKEQKNGWTPLHWAAFEGEQC